jgi:hypothetical protein
MIVVISFIGQVAEILKRIEKLIICDRSPGLMMQQKEQNIHQA